MKYILQGDKLKTSRETDKKMRENINYKYQKL